MTPLPDEAAAHRFFAASCFNHTWELLDRPARTADESEAMIACCLASLWHWRCCADCTPQNLSIGYWLASRVYAVLGQASNAWRYGELCLEVSHQESPFYLGYAYEALARAAKLGGDASLQQRYYKQAVELAARLPEGDEREMLLKDLCELAVG